MFCDTLKVGYLDKDRILCRHIWKLYPECYLQKIPHQMIACSMYLQLCSGHVIFLQPPK